jgi:hypothetical protein
LCRSERGKHFDKALAKTSAHFTKHDDPFYYVVNGNGSFGYEVILFCEAVWQRGLLAQNGHSP